MDSYSVYMASQVNDNWCKIIKSDRKMRISLRPHVRTARNEKLRQNKLNFDEELHPILLKKQFFPLRHIDDYKQIKTTNRPHFLYE